LGRKLQCALSVNIKFFLGQDAINATLQYWHQLSVNSGDGPSTGADDQAAMMVQTIYPFEKGATVNELSALAVDE